MTRPRSRAFAAITVGVLAAACTFDEGHGFSTLEAGSIEVRLEPGAARDLGDGKILTDLGYEVQVDAATIEIAGVELLELSGGGGDTSFDPSHPPAGYTFCHGGHCHAEDGRLVDYADVEADLAGGGAKLVPVVTMPVERDLDWLVGARADLDRFEPSPDLPQARITKLVVRIAHVAIDGAVSAGPTMGGLGGTAATLAVDIDAKAAMSTGLSLAIDRDGPERTRVRVTAVTDGTLFDGIDFAARVVGGAIDLVDIDDADVNRLTGAVSASAVSVSME